MLNRVDSIDDLQDLLSNWNPNQKQSDKNEKIVENDLIYANLQISVIDTGIGISPEGLKCLFIDFSKLQENSNRNKGGTGLGLSICKKIIEQMGGNVEVKSTLGVGTSFIINIKTQCKVKNTNLINQSVDQINSGSLIFLEQDP